VEGGESGGSGEGRQEGGRKEILGDSTSDFNEDDEKKEKNEKWARAKRKKKTKFSDFGKYNALTL
jgi:hypothetical protein